MTSRTQTVTLDTVLRDRALRITCLVDPGFAGRFSGPPDAWSEPEPPSLDGVRSVTSVVDDVPLCATPETTAAWVDQITEDEWAQIEREALDVWEARRWETSQPLWPNASP